MKTSIHKPTPVRRTVRNTVRSNPSRSRRLIVKPMLWMLCLTALASPAPAAEGEPTADERLATLRARVAELEKTLRQVTEETPAPKRPEPVSTRDAAAAIESVEFGKTEKDYILRLANLSMERRAPELYAEIEENLLAGPQGWVRLYDFVDELEEDKRASIRFFSNYTNKFGLVHFAMLHDVQLARFFHFYLIASQGNPRSYLRRQFYNYAPDFLRFHAARFPELEGALHLDILERLEKRDMAMETLFQAMETLLFFPDINLIWPHLERANTIKEWNLVLGHLQARDDRYAVRAIMRFIEKQPDYRLNQVRYALTTLVRMTNEDAEEAIQRYFNQDLLKGPATRAYFSVPREAHTASLAVEFLNSKVPLGEKRALLSQLRVSSPDVLRGVEQRLAQVRDPALEPIVRAEIARIAAE